MLCQQAAWYVFNLKPNDEKKIMRKELLKCEIFVELCYGVRSKDLAKNKDRAKDSEMRMVEIRFQKI